jgi:uncharacterized membrane protein YeaQ/YmgE (transglycosylase-associated protein family)
VAWWAIALVGLGGGVANSLLLEENSLILPAIRLEAGRRKLDLGFLSNVALGIAAAFLPYLFGISKLSHHQQLGVSLVAAIGGASFINTFIQRNQTRLIAAQSEALDWVLRQMYEERKR